MTTADETTTVTEDTTTVEATTVTDTTTADESTTVAEDTTTVEATTVTDTTTADETTTVTEDTTTVEAITVTDTTTADETTTVAEDTTTAEATTTVLDTTTADETTTVAEDTTTAEATTVADTTTAHETTTVAEDTTTAEATTTVADTTTSDETSTVAEDITTAEATTTVPDTTTSDETTTVAEDTTTAEATTVVDTTTADETTTVAEDKTTAETTTVADMTTADETTTVAEDTTTAEATTTVADTTSAADETTTAADDTITTEATTAVADTTTAVETTTVAEDTTTVEATTTAADETTTTSGDTTTAEGTTDVVDTVTPSNETTTAAEFTTTAEATTTTAKATTTVADTTAAADETTTVAEGTTMAETSTAVADTITAADETTAAAEDTTTAEATTVADTTTAAHETTTKAEDTTTAEATTTVDATIAADEITTAAEDTTTSEATTTVLDTTSAAGQTTAAAEDITTSEATTTVADSTTAADETTTTIEDTTTSEATTTMADTTTAADESTTAIEDTTTAEATTTVPDTTTAAEEITTVVDDTTTTSATTTVMESTTATEETATAGEDTTEAEATTIVMDSTNAAVETTTAAEDTTTMEQMTTTMMPASTSVPPVACTSEPCQNGATCQGGDNFFNCTCSAGFIGPLCQFEKNGCIMNPCRNGGRCTNRLGNYTCACSAGYTGVNCTEDIDECASSPCQHNSRCEDLDNAYTCHCMPGFTGTECQTGKDECESNPCQHGAPCEDKVNGYTCRCLENLYTGPNCDTAVPHRLYPYGAAAFDASIFDNWGIFCNWWGHSCSTGFIDIPEVPMFDSQFHNIKIYSSGYVTLGEEFTRCTPGSFDSLLNNRKRQSVRQSGFAMLAPLWSDTHVSSSATFSSYTNVYYHIYDRTDTLTRDVDATVTMNYVLEKAKDDAMNYGGVSDIEPTWVMVVTWKNMQPRLWYRPYVEKPNTFQLVLMYDPSRWTTFAMFLYEETGWDQYFYVRQSYIGYYVTQNDVSSSLTLPQSGLSTAFALDSIMGNTGENGQHFFRLATGNRHNNYRQMCREWSYKENTQRWQLYAAMRWTAPCPCDMRLAMWDRRWRFDEDKYIRTGHHRQCFYERLPAAMASQSCCYDWWGSLMTREATDAGNFFRYHPTYRVNHYLADVLPKEWCCERSDLCHLFYNARPLDRCYGYSPPFLGWFFGDPHIRTLDGLEYTFNGLGEYTLLETTDGNFTLQGRTVRALDANNTDTMATVFGAFAARDAMSDRFHIEMNSSRNGLIVRVDNKDWSSWFRAANISDEKAFDGVTLAKTNESSLDATFRTGVTLSVGVKAEQLDITVAAPKSFENITQGLLGVFNGNKSDDLTPPDGATPLDPTNESMIFFQFGQKWRVEKGNSLFWYDNGTSYETVNDFDFQPKFVEDVLAAMTRDNREAADIACKNNTVCLFDFAVTGKEDVAAATLQTDEKNKVDSETLANASPKIYVQSTWNITVGQNKSLMVNVSDPDDDPMTLTLETTLPPGATFDNQTGVFWWLPQSTDTANISFRASDGKGGFTSTVITINLCNCSDRGECLFDKLADGEKNSASFRLVTCNCSTGWTGVHCEEDYDGCGDNPCGQNCSCTDLSPTEQQRLGRAYNCCECQPGATKDNNSEICRDINECSEGQHNCLQGCINTDPGFTCVCNLGYRMNENNTCIDIDECKEMSDGCEHKCTNTEGGFSCSCLGGYKLNSDNNKTCTDELRLCDRMNLACDHGCVESNGTVGCFCRVGYQLASDLSNCTDIDECVTGAHTCSNHSTCKNLNGGYTCTCDAGFKLLDDRRTCKPCPVGQWGENCSKYCNCKNQTTYCSSTKGCAMCQAGFKGGDCSEDINECDTNPCDRHANCTNTIGTFRCDCHTGFIQYNATACVEVNRCNSYPCQNGATCRPGSQNYTCECEPGYTGSTCETDINECTSNPCQHGATCHNRVGKYRCACVSGYTGVDCEINIDDCASDPCLGNSDCIDLLNNFTCACRPGYSGADCNTDVDECAKNPCKNGATCSTPQVNMYKCNCTDGFNGTNCDFGELCLARPCDNGATCSEVNGTRSCTCVLGYTGANCETDIDECSYKLCRYGSNCTNLVGNYSCQCVPGYVGINCDKNPDECLSSPCQNRGMCIDHLNEYTCECKPGFNGSHCETNIDDCLTQPCQHGAICVDGINSYMCRCVTGYTGENCETDVDECRASPCQNNGTCVDGINGFTCNCSKEYNGTLCETEIITTTTEVTSTTTEVTVTTMSTTTPVVSTTPLSPESQTRLNIYLQLVDLNVTSDLVDKTTPTYKSYKQTFVNTLMTVLEKGVTRDHFQIVDVTFRPPSGVSYVLGVQDKYVNSLQDVLKQSTVNGTFGQYKILNDSLTITERTIMKYFGTFTIVNREFTASLGVKDSPEYTALATSIMSKLDAIFRSDVTIGVTLLGITDIVFRKGSVVVEFVVRLDSATQPEVLTSLLRQGVEDNKLEPYKVSINTVRFSEAEFPQPETLPILAIVLGSLVGITFLVMLVLVVIYAVRRCRHEHSTSDVSDSTHDFASSTTLGYIYPKQNRFWQQRSATMGEDTVAPTTYENQRMNIVCNAVRQAPNIDWSMMRNFSRRNIGQDDLLHRNQPISMPARIFSEEERHWTRPEDNH